MVSIQELSQFANNLVTEKNNLEKDFLVFREEMKVKNDDLVLRENNIIKQEINLDERRKELQKDMDSLNTTKEVIEGIKREALQLQQKGNCDIEIAKKIRKELENKERQLDFRANYLNKQEILLLQRAKDIQMKENNFILLMEKQNAN